MEATNEVVNRKIKIQSQWFKKENCIKRKKHDVQKSNKSPKGITTSPRTYTKISPANTCLILSGTTTARIKMLTLISKK